MSDRLPIGVEHDASLATLTWVRTIPATLTWVSAIAVSALVIAVLMARDLRPAPAYGDMKNPEAPAYAVTRDHPVSVELALPTPAEGFVIPVEIASQAHPLLVTFTDASQNHGSSELRESGSPWLRAPQSLRGTRVRIAFGSDTNDLALAPRLLRSNQPPSAALVREVSVDGNHVTDRGPLLLVTYSWPSRLGWLAWLLVPLALWYASRSEKRLPHLVVVLGIVVMITSVLLWQRQYSQDMNHWDADDYGKCAQALASLLTNPSGRAAAFAWLHDYPHTHTSLAPLLMCAPIALGARPEVVYVIFSSLCGFASLILFHRLLRARLTLSARTSALWLTAFACHLLMLRTFARPVTDGFGLLLTLATLDALLVRLQGSTRGNTVALAVLMLLHPLARPQGLAYMPFVAAATIACDWWRERRWQPASMIKTLLCLCLPAAAVLATLYFALGLTHNVALMLRKAQDYRDASVLKYFVACIIGLVQLWPVLWLGALPRSSDRRWWLLMAWSVYYLTMLVAVRAPFWPRHFLPVLPVVMALSAWGFEQGGRTLRRAASFLIGVLCAVNVGFVVIQLYVWSDAPRPFLFFWRN